MHLQRENSLENYQTERENVAVSVPGLGNRYYGNMRS